jgi:uncharacterized protein
MLWFFTSARLLGVVVLLLVVVLTVLHWLADLFWFQALGYAEVFWRLLLCQLGLFAAATCVVFIYAWGNLRVLGRHVDLAGTARIPTPPGATSLLQGPTSTVRLRLIRTVDVLAPLVAAIIVGFGFAQGWDELLRFLWAQPFDQTEPLYGHDVAFYLFDLPAPRADSGHRDICGVRGHRGVARPSALLRSRCALTSPVQPSTWLRSRRTGPGDDS